MARIIASTYEMLHTLGSGGGGIVYLGRHLRLNKNVVLKADKCALSDKPESEQRREVETLKNLSHTYLPQVYDFIIEDDVAYTVMDYIEGESLNKHLERREHFKQSRVIKWSRQILEALSYLHSPHPEYPYGILHSDIKPANIMLTSKDDIRLIDFNISLALGAEGAAVVGLTPGYASPEHYGSQETSGSDENAIASTLSLKSQEGYIGVTKTLPPNSTLPLSSGSSKRKGIQLDARSDIYGVGATLYHLFTNRRPAQKAENVIPLSEKDVSPRIAAIINKAMNPVPELRYQTAADMLFDFNHLHESDPRAKRHKRAVRILTSVLLFFFLAGGFTTFIGLRRMEQLQNMYVLTEYSANALRAGDVPLAVNYALQALPEKRDIFTPPNTAEAQKALTDALNVYDLSDGFKAHKIIEVPSAPMYMELSPSGKTFSCIYAYDIAVIDTDTAELITSMPTEKSALSTVRYVGEDIIIYAGSGGVTAYDIVKNVVLWVGRPATSITVSDDGKVAAAVYKDEKTATIYDISSGDIICEVDFMGKHQRVTVNDVFANPNDNLLALNHDGTLLGVSFADGSLLLYDLKDSNNDLEIFDNISGYTHFEGGFFAQYFAFSASNSDSSVFAVIDTVEIEQTGGFESTSPYGVQADENGIFVQTDNLLVKIHPVTGEQSPLVATGENILRFARSDTHTLIAAKNEYMFFDEAANLISRYKKDYGSSFVDIAGDTAIVGSSDTPVIQIMKLENYPENEIFSYDPEFVHDETRISSDKQTIMLFTYDRFQLYDKSGSMIADVAIPDSAQVYDQQYRRDENGSYLEVVYNDGTVRGYSAHDGQVLYETARSKPDPTLFEEFFTDTMRFEAPLHGISAAYDRNSGRLVRELEKDAYLVYVTQVGEYIITEYITAEGNRYGLLLNDRCETLARLPYLCDVIEEELIFDYPAGKLRKSKIYHINELIEVAQKRLES